MGQPYTIYGAEMSPYSVKVRAYFRYKNIPYRWVVRSQANDDAFKKYARLPLIPLVVTPDQRGMQDSTPIIEALDPLYPEPGLWPADPTLSFLAILLEEFGDEWGNKLMFHHRWWDEADQLSAARILAWRLVAPGDDGDDVVAGAAAAKVRERMTGRGDFVGSNADTAPLIRAYLLELLELLESHLEGRRYLLGDTPSFADFGLAPQLYETAMDPTGAGLMHARTPNTLAWCYRMLEPATSGPYQDWDSLQPTLEPMLRYVGRYFLPWTDANAKALVAGKERFSVLLEGKAYHQPPQKYHARSLGVLREKFAAVSDNRPLCDILDRTGCLPYLLTNAAKQ